MRLFGSWRRVVLLLAVAAVATVAASPAGGAAPTPAKALVVSGHGFGHGIGLSQWGAEERAEAGWSYRRILSFYYPGTTLGLAAPREVRVLLAERPVVRVGSSSPFTIRDATGTTLRLPPGAYSVDASGRIGTRSVLLPAVVEPGAAPVRLGGTRYDGRLALDADGAEIQVVNTLDLEDYLVGVVSSECPGYWRADALRAQAVASRSYALANLHPAEPFDLYADDRSQNYHGLARRLSAAAAAVAATRGEVLRYRGEVVDALFSAANGGLTSVADGIWTNGSRPYFAARRDTFDEMSPNTNWGPLVLPLAKLRQAFPELPTEVASVTLIRNAGQRVTALTFTGADGASVSIGGYAFQQRVGLRSTYLTVETS